MDILNNKQMNCRATDKTHRWYFTTTVITWRPGCIEKKTDYTLDPQTINTNFILEPQTIHRDFRITENTFRLYFKSTDNT